MNYYVTVIDAGRHGFLLGPYDTHEQALEQVQTGKERAMAANTWAHFYAYGTARVPKEKTVKTVFGK